MNVREYAESDLAEIERLHRASGFDYALPNLSGAEFFSRRIVEDRDGLAMAGFLRLTAEAMLIADGNWRTPAWRMEALRQLHAVCYRDAADKGVCEVNAFIPPKISCKFGNRLLRLGWKAYQGPEWRCFGFEVNPG